jgi:dTDP-glucose 4,6-dehydratase
MRLLITGGAGFIGSNFVRHMLASRKDLELINFDKLTYAGNLENLADQADDRRYRFVRGDIAVAEDVAAVLADGCDAIVNFAAETHVDRSILEAAPFLRTNVFGTQILLEAARRQRVPLFLQIGTDEVYGSAPAGKSFDEQQLLDPRSPYSASKAAADHLVNAYACTFGLPAMIVRCTNNFGPFQFPEKLIPLMIANALEDKPIPVYGDGMNERDWLFVTDFCHAIGHVLDHGKAGEIYNVSAGTPRPNLTVIRTILRELNKPESLIQFVTDRPGHDRRYALDSSKLRATGWHPQVGFDDGIRRTIEWYRNNRGWLLRTRSGEYRDYYDRHYVRRDETLKTLAGSTKPE